MKPTIINIDYKKFREERHKFNNDIVFNAIKVKDDALFEEYINKKEFERVLAEVCKTKTELLNECRENDTMNRILAGRISKLASRQGLLLSEKYPEKKEIKLTM